MTENKKKFTNRSFFSSPSREAMLGSSQSDLTHRITHQNQRMIGERLSRIEKRLDRIDARQRLVGNIFVAVVLGTGVYRWWKK